MCGQRDWFTDAGKEFHDKNRSRLNCAKLTQESQNNFPTHAIKSDRNSGPNVHKFLEESDKVFLNNPKHKCLIIKGLFQALMKVGLGSSKKKTFPTILIYFFRVINVMSSKSCAFIKSNLEIGPSNRHTRKLN